MPGSVTLPRWLPPAFPDRCLVCGAATPENTTRLVARDGLQGAALWAGWFTTRIPCCRPCARRFHAWRAWSIARTLAIAGGSLAFGIVVLLPRYPGWVCGLTVLGLCILGFAVVFVWNRFFPPAFDLDPHAHTVEYEFRDANLAREFAELNGAVEEPPDTYTPAT